MELDIQQAVTREDLERCYPVMAQLRPHLRAAEFIARVQGQIPQGYHLVYAVDGDRVVVTAGYRTLCTLAWGKVLYVDDLVTDAEARSRGYGRAMLQWLVAEARRLGSDELHLDSNHERVDAHRFYQREGLENASLHFRLRLHNATSS